MNEDNRNETREQLVDIIRSKERPNPRTMRVLSQRFYDLAESCPEPQTGLLAGSGRRFRRLFEWLRGVS